MNPKQNPSQNRQHSLIYSNVRRLLTTTNVTPQTLSAAIYDDRKGGTLYKV